MLQNKILLHEIYTGLKESTLTPYIITNSPDGVSADSVLVCPGGGYHFVSDREATPIAKRFNQLGFNVFVLDYATKDRFKDTIFPTQLRQAAAAMHYIRTNREMFGIGEKVAVCGFSAGGHLAASLSTLFYKDYVLDFLNADESVVRPDASILCYPVISSANNPHEGSINTITNGDFKLMEEVSLEKQITPKTPPTFIWHTFEDLSVNVSNAYDYAQALHKNNIPTEMHIYNFGGHGLSLATEETGRVDTQVAGWIELCANWLKRTNKQASE